MAPNWTRRRLALTVVGAMLTGCAGLPLPPVGQTAAAIGASGVDHDPLTAFTLQPGDILAVDLATVPAKAHVGLVVDGRGALHVPGVGDIEVGRRTTAQAERAIEEQLARSDSLGTVAVRVTHARGHRMTVLGAVAEPGSVEIAPGTRIASVYAAAGGSSDPTAVDGADLGAARLVRNGEALPVDLERALTGDPRHNVLAHPRDLLVVPRGSARISILGQVGAPSVVRHRRGLRLTEALASAGGVTQQGDKSDVRLIRGPGDEAVVYRADVTAIADGRRADVALQPGDVLFVTDDPLEDTTEILAVVGPVIGLALTAAVLSLTLSSD